MIALLRGRVAIVEQGAVVVDAEGVGYRVHVPTSVAADLREGDEVTLRTHLHVRESELTLYGAHDEASLRLFKELLGVSGVGPRAALAMLSAFDAAALRDAIVQEDLQTLTSVRGIGRKTAQRVVLDLRPRLESEDDALGLTVGGASMRASGADMDAIAALTALGYTVPEARRALAASGVDETASTEERVEGALRGLGGGQG